MTLAVSILDCEKTGVVVHLRPLSVGLWVKKKGRVIAMSILDREKINR